MEKRLEDMEYPGRGIIIGNTKDTELFCAYFLTGRSPSSQARKLVAGEGKISTEPTDLNTISQGNIYLLVYNAILWKRDAIAVSNGNQTDSILAGTLKGIWPFKECTKDWEYEPDAPIYTPRINGRILRNEGPHGRFLAELGIIRKGVDGKSERIDYSLDIEGGKKAYCITTYGGPNIKPLPIFEGKPFAVGFGSSSASGICQELGDMLNPEFRVSAATVVFPEEGIPDYNIMNFRV